MARNPYVFFDARIHSPMTVDGFYEILSNTISDLVAKLDKLKHIINAFKRIESIEVMGARIRFREKRLTTIARVLEVINDHCRDHGVKAIIVFDEVQELRFIRGFTRLLAHIYDYYQSIKIVLAGSEVGVLDRILGVSNPQAPLYGRAFLEIIMKRLSREKALDFLEKGFSEVGLKPRVNELEEAVDKLDGIIGWLTYYGYHAIRKGHKRAIRETIREGALLVRNEIERFLSNRPQARNRYLHILKNLYEPRTWSEIRDILSILVGRRLHSQQVTRYIRELLDYGFIVKENKYYKLADPLIKEAVRNMK